MASSSTTLCDDIILLITEHYLDSILNAYESTERYYAADAVLDLRNYIDVFPNMSQAVCKSIDSRLARLEEKAEMFHRAHVGRVWDAGFYSSREEVLRLCCLSYIKRHLF